MAEFTINPNVGELGHTLSSARATTATCSVSIQDAEVGDQIMVLAFAPSDPDGVSPNGTPDTVTDSHGNTYNLTLGSNWEASPANVNEGVRWRMFLSDPITQALEAGVDTVTVTWTNSVFDRNVYLWLVRFPNPIGGLWGLGGTGPNDAAVRASGQVTQAPGNYTPRYDNGMMMAIFIVALPGTTTGFAAVPGFDGFYQARFEALVGAKQNYYVLWQTHGADAYVIASSGVTPYEDDIAKLPGGVLVPSFNGAGQQYSGGAGNWKGVVIFGLPESL